MHNVSSPFSKGYIHVYTGDGKGKTTAALGLALRAIGAGIRVFFAQFVKGKHYSEIDSLENFSDRMITVRQYGLETFIHDKPSAEDISLVRKGLSEVRKIIQSGEYGLIILDEATIANFFSLFSVDELLEVISEKPEQVELVITGRRADPRLIEAADLVTEMKEIKHYYQQGVKARKGIES